MHAPSLGHLLLALLLVAVTANAQALDSLPTTVGNGSAGAAYVVQPSAAANGSAVLATAGLAAPAPAPSPADALILTLSGADGPLNAGVVADQLGQLVTGGTVSAIGYVANVTLVLPGVSRPAPDSGGVTPQLDLENLLASAVAALLPSSVQRDIGVGLQDSPSGLLVHIKVGQAATASRANETLQAVVRQVNNRSFDQVLSQMAANANVASTTSLSADALHTLRIVKASVVIAELSVTATVSVPHDPGSTARTNPALVSVYNSIVASGTLADSIQAATGQAVTVTGYQDNVIFTLQANSPAPAPAPTAPPPTSAGHQSSLSCAACLLAAMLGAAVLLLL